MRKLSDFYKSLFGCKVYKISLNAGCTCPNRDGTKGTGGCIFCSSEGSGDFIFDSNSIEKQFIYGRKLIESKAKGRSGTNKVLYLPYFQSFTSTYGDSQKLKSLYLAALKQSQVCGIAVATRPDCITEQIIKVFQEISSIQLDETHQSPFIQIELGLQTSNENTGKLINRCYTNADYERAIKLLNERLPDVHIVTHIIAGLPGEDLSDLIKTINFVNNANDYGDKFFGIKITNLYVLKGTILENLYNQNKFKCLEQDQYFNMLEQVIPLLKSNCVIHRLNGDPPKKSFVSPDWCLNKKAVLTKINNLLEK